MRWSWTLARTGYHRDRFWGLFQNTSLLDDGQGLTPCEKRASCLLFRDDRILPTAQIGAGLLLFLARPAPIGVFGIMRTGHQPNDVPRTPLWRPRKTGMRRAHWDSAAMSWLILLQCPGYRNQMSPGTES